MANSQAHSPSDISPVEVIQSLWGSRSGKIADSNTQAYLDYYQRQWAYYRSEHGLSIFETFNDFTSVLEQIKTGATPASIIANFARTAQRQKLPSARLPILGQSRRANPDNAQHRFWESILARHIPQTLSRCSIPQRAVARLREDSLPQGFQRLVSAERRYRRGVYR